MPTHSANTAAVRPCASVQHTSMAAHSEASVHSGFPVQERFKCVEAFFLQIYRSENRRNNIIYQGEKKKKDMLERRGEMLAKGQEWKREESIDAGKTDGPD